MPTAITFNSYDLNSETVITNQVDDSQAPERELAIYSLVRSGGAVITNAEYGKKTIPATGTLIGTSVENLEALIDEFNVNLSEQKKNLDIGYNGTTRRYVCTAARVQIERPVRAASWANWSVDFIATSYGIETSATNLLSAETHTAASHTEALLFGGSAPEQCPVIEIEVTAATDLSGKTITVENDTTGVALSVSRTWVVGEVLAIDVLNKSVTVDGVEVDFDGGFPDFKPGTHDMIFTNNFTTRTLTVTVNYVKRYL